jgi:glucosamine-6-phosphate deaminase
MLLRYLDTAHPGQKDPAEIQRLKGMIREWEAETLWGVLGVPPDRVHHLRLGFYQGDIFTEEPTGDRDVPPVLSLIRSFAPDVLTVALDPEASGPDTHYKVLQAIAAAIRRLQEGGLPVPSRFWGYRNVWYRFHPAEANRIVPVSEEELDLMDQLFCATFVSQKDASFPSHEHEGPFSGLARRIQVEQFTNLETCLGREWFARHPDARVRSACGLVFLHEMDLPAFLDQCRDLQRTTEAGN